MREASKKRGGFCETIGRTPMIRLNALSDATGCEIWGKAEFMNPGGSVKDRAALAIVEAAEKSGQLEPGGTIVEGTAGNTGIGLTLVGNSRGYKSIIVVPDTQAIEKIDTLRAMGAEVKTVPVASYSDPGNYNHVARRIAEQTPRGFWANQFDNTANRDAHYRTTGPEIWEQTEGKITGFVSAVGTGGTLNGTARFLKERTPSIHTVCADPFGAAMYSWIKRGNLDDDEGDSITEGIGQARLTANFEGAPIDDAYRIADPVIIEMLYFALKHEGLFLGSSSAINLCGAAKLAMERGPGQTIVTVLCDSGSRYLSKLFDSEWLKEQRLTPKAKGIEFLSQLRS